MNCWLYESEVIEFVKIRLSPINFVQTILIRYECIEEVDR